MIWLLSILIVLFVVWLLREKRPIDWDAEEKKYHMSRFGKDNKKWRISR